MKIIKDTYDDEAWIDHRTASFTGDCGGRVLLCVIESDPEARDEHAELSLTPKQARRLAKAIRKAADRAEEATA